MESASINNSYMTIDVICILTFVRRCDDLLGKAADRPIRWYRRYDVLYMHSVWTFPIVNMMENISVGFGVRTLFYLKHQFHYIFFNVDSAKAVYTPGLVSTNMRPIFMKDSLIKVYPGYKKIK